MTKITLSMAILLAILNVTSSFGYAPYPIPGSIKQDSLIPTIQNTMILRPSKPVNIVGSLEMIATAYDLSVADCGKSRSHPEYGITFSGKRAKKNHTVAVDPRTIPLGTKLLLVFPEGKYEKYSGEYVAEDTGSAVKGNIIDIFLGEDEPGDNTIKNEVEDFWSKKVTVYIIK